MYIYVNEDSLIVFAAYPSQSPVSCDGEVRSNLPAGTLYLKKTCEKVDAGGSYLFWPLKKLGHENLGSEEKGGSQVYAHIVITGIFLMLQYGTNGETI